MAMLINNQFNKTDISYLNERSDGTFIGACWCVYCDNHHNSVNTYFHEGWGLQRYLIVQSTQAVYNTCGVVATTKLSIRTITNDT